ncbi:hypothetical protein [Gallaecimonas sp. GXIMD4217]|uniref:hypothetical protein n=1 Tax=Gallaecimonas sp. GXIMD4217 TaxID=3131927 RepID=UPI00311B1935
MNAFIMLMRKELWENRKTVLWLPVVLALGEWGLWLLLSLAGTGANVQVEANAPAGQLLYILALPFFFTTALAVITYSGNCLLGERKDRSILFWRSLPVSDWQTMAAKALVAMVLIPGINYLALVLFELPVALLSPDLGLVAALKVWTQLGSHLLWLSLLMAPFYAFMMLLSATTDRPLVWMFLTPLLVFFAESLLLDGHPVSSLVFGTLAGELMIVMGSLMSQSAFSLGASWLANSAVLSTSNAMLAGLAVALIIWGLCAEIRRRNLIQD